MNTKLSVIILCKNAQETIEAAIKSADFADEVLVINNQSNDKSVAIAKKHKARVVDVDSKSFSQLRNRGMEAASGTWLFYLDADEVITPKLKQKIKHIVKTHPPAAFTVNRTNYFLGVKMYPDRVHRLFHRSILKGWSGVIHESPMISGKVIDLIEAIEHHTHRDISSMLEKTNHWSEHEAQLRLEAGHPPVKWWRLVRIALTVAWQQVVHKKVWRFGRAGIFEGYFQIIDKLIVYTKLWELQHTKE